MRSPPTVAGGPVRLDSIAPRDARPMPYRPEAIRSRRRSTSAPDSCRTRASTTRRSTTRSSTRRGSRPTAGPRAGPTSPRGCPRTGRPLRGASAGPRAGDPPVPQDELLEVPGQPAPRRGRPGPGQLHRCWTASSSSRRRRWPSRTRSSVPTCGWSSRSPRSTSGRPTIWPSSSRTATSALICASRGSTTPGETGSAPMPHGQS